MPIDDTAKNKLEQDCKETVKRVGHPKKEDQNASSLFHAIIGYEPEMLLEAEAEMTEEAVLGYNHSMIEASRVLQALNGFIDDGLNY